MQMMNVLKPIAFDVVICMSQLFDYYLFAVSRLRFICFYDICTRYENSVYFFISLFYNASC